MYALGWDWERMCAEVARQAAVSGIGGLEMVITQGDKDDPEIELIEVDGRDFFYDINSQKARLFGRQLRGHDALGRS
jgi:hypothetical protein